MPDAVVDIGNSRIKFCRVRGGQLQLPVRGMVADDLAGWERLATEWELKPDHVWSVAGTNSRQLVQFLAWAQSRGERVIHIDSSEKIPIVARVDEPKKVGIDRLLNALSARALVRPGQPAIMVDAGSAVTVDLLTAEGEFAGGTIFPGLRLMALSMHQHTSALPLVEPLGAMPEGPPGKNTIAAMRLGMIHAVAGGIDSIIRELASRCSEAPIVFLAGGDMTPQLAGLIQTRHSFKSEVRPSLTLEGLLRSAELVS